MENIVVRKSNLQDACIPVSGFKHAFVSVVSACVAARGKLKITNAPEILEVRVFAKLLSKLNCDVTIHGSEFSVDCHEVRPHSIDPELSSYIHGAMYLVPALAVSVGQASLAQSGGCAIGDGKNGLRPTKHLLRIMRAFGLRASADDAGGLFVEDSKCMPSHVDIMDFSDRSDVLTGPEISGATKAALICAGGTQSGSVSSVANPYLKPDVLDLARYLKLAGYAVDQSPAKIVVTKRPNIRPVEMALTPDLSEIMTYLTLGVMTGKDIRVSADGISLARHGLEQESKVLDRIGLRLRTQENQMWLDRPEIFQATDIDVTSVGIYSDHQPFFALILSRAKSSSRIREFVWKNRFTYADPLRKLGVKIEDVEDGIQIFPSEISNPNGPLVAKDLRMAATLLIASLCPTGPVRLENMSHLDRGYSNIWEHLQQLGADISFPENEA